jgi:glycosyltransferase involved in cell wall biosynthesis
MQPKFSILIPTWNNLPFLQLCVASIRKNSAYPHQIIVHVNQGTDGTLDWVRSQGLDYTYSPENIGVCLAMNAMRSRVQCDYIFYLNDDMYLLPGWDTALIEEIERLPDNRFFLSGTMIQPHSPLDVGILADYGDTVETFQEERLLREYMNYPKADWAGATWPPNLLHRDLWDLVGGYSIEYTPGMYSDPDFTAKLWLFGVRYMKGLSASRVYHFESKSTGKVRKNNGQMQFLMKWGMTSSTFRKLYTWRGRDFSPTLIDNPESGSRLRMNIIRGRLKALWYVVRGTFRPIL